MKFIKTLCCAFTLSILGLTLSGCENTHVSGSMSYSMGVGYGYPMYYGPRGYNHTNVVVVRPPRHSRPVNRPRRR